MSGSPAIPILCFHAVEDGPGPLCFPPLLFERQVTRLREDGWRSITVAEVARRIASGRAFPERAVAFTFDDGYASVHERALAMLADAGFTATVYPVTAHLGATSAWITDPPRRLPMLAETQLRELHAAGWEVGGHTHTHPHLPGLSSEQIGEELRRSNGILEHLTGDPVTTFAYPSGRHDRGCRTAASAIYAACVTNGASKATLSSPLDRLERVEAWYLQRAWQARHLDDPLGDAYLALRRAARGARRLSGRLA